MLFKKLIKLTSACWSTRATEADSVSDPDVEPQSPTLLSDSAYDIHMATFDHAPPYSIEDALRRYACTYEAPATPSTYPERQNTSQMPNNITLDRNGLKRKREGSPSVRHAKHDGCLQEELPRLPVNHAFAISRYSSSEPHALLPEYSTCPMHLDLQHDFDSAFPRAGNQPHNQQTGMEEALAMIGKIHDAEDRYVINQILICCCHTDKYRSTFRTEDLVLDEEDQDPYAVLQYRTGQSYEEGPLKS